MQATVDRLVPLVGERVVVVTGAAHQAGRTTPAALASPGWSPSRRRVTRWPRSGSRPRQLEREDPDALIGSFAADHVITDEDAFAACVREAAAVARTGLLVTIGIQPDAPATGLRLHPGR